MLKYVGRAKMLEIVIPRVTHILTIWPQHLLVRTAICQHKISWKTPKLVPNNISLKYVIYLVHINWKWAIVGQYTTIPPPYDLMAVIL